MMPTRDFAEEREVNPAIDTTSGPALKRKQSDLAGLNETAPELQPRHKRPRPQDDHGHDESSPACTHDNPQEAPEEDPQKDAQEDIQEDSQEVSQKDSLDDLPSDDTEEDDLKYARDSLRRHIQETTAVFFLELTPSSTARGAACKLPNCNEQIREHDYRVAVYPGMYNVWRSSDFFHVRCFEKLADFSNEEYFKRLNPLTRSTFPLRGIKATSIMDGKYLVDGGAERLILQWMHSMECHIAKRDGIQQSPLNRDLEDILYKAGSAEFSPKKPEAMSHFEFFNLCHPLAPIESGGAEDKKEWNLFESYLPVEFDDFKNLDEPHSLSSMLESWHVDKFLANSEVDRLTEKGKEARAKLGEKAIKGIRRLSTIPMPDFQSAFHGMLGF